ncbi:MAG: lysophospholipase [Planctomycetales bacterium]|nr:lysophospholipase [Planctomycetales bacterium]
MKKTAQWLEISPGQSKYVTRWLPESAPQANVVIVHGLGEHGGRYDSLAQHFVQAGFSVSAFDQQGHGRSPEPRGKIRSYNSMLDDIASFLKWNQAKQANTPTVMFGHSMGGNLVINYALRNYPQPERVISSSPMLEKATPVHPGFLRFARWLMRITPNIKIRSEVVVERLMSDPVEQQMLRDDELFHSQITLRLGAGLLDSGAWALEHAGRVKTALLLSHGSSDYLTSFKASVEFARLAGETCELVALDGELHDPFRSLQREAILARYVDFIRGAIDQPRPMWPDTPPSEYVESPRASKPSQAQELGQ